MAEYLGNNDSDLMIRAEFTCKTDNRLGSPKSIKNKFKEEYNDDVKEKHHTNRQMWPKKELTGVEYNICSNIVATITPFKIKINIDNIHLFEEGYNNLEKVFDNLGYNLPNINNFKTDAITFYSINDEYAFVYDETKCLEKSMMGCRFDFKNHTGFIDSYNGYVSVVFSQNEESEDIVSYDTLKRYIAKIIESEIVIKIDSDNIESNPNTQF